MVEVFKTNVTKIKQSEKLVQKLHEHFPESKINFDLDDCDRVLRIEGINISPNKITEIMKINGFECMVLE